MPKPLNRKEIQHLSNDLSVLVGKIEEGELDATSSMQKRIEGAVTALEVVLGHWPDDLFLIPDSHG